MTPAERLKFIRKRTNLSQREFAEILNEKVSRINSIESGKQSKFPYDLAEKILQNFSSENYSFKWITTGEGDPNEGQILSPQEQDQLERAEQIIDRLIPAITNAEFELIIECLLEKKELTIMLLKKLKSDEKAAKRFLLE